MGRARQSLRQIGWPTGTWAGLAFHGITFNTNTYTFTETAYGALRRGRVAWASGAEGNDRRMYLLPDYERDTRLMGVWQAHPLKAAGNAQLGLALRVRDDPDGLTRAIIIRHDLTFAQDHGITAGLWTWPTNNPANVLNIDVALGGAFLSGIERIVNATDASRTANVVTAVGLPAGHGIKIGDTISADFADNTYDGTTFVVTGTPSATSLTWAQVAADDASAGAGTVQDLDGVFPLAIEAVLIGSQCWVRCWRIADQSRPSWSDDTRAFLADFGTADPYAGRRGRSGFYFGHITPAAAGFAEFGALERERIR